MSDELDSPYAVLAEILTSKKIGLRHVRLVGEVVVAQADLNAPRREGERKLSLSQLAELSERVADAEERYKNAWRDLNASSVDSVSSTGLGELEDALRETVATFFAIRQELDNGTYPASN